MRVTMPLIAPSTAAPSMIVNSGAPLTNASDSSATGTLTSTAIAMHEHAARIAQPTGLRFGRHHQCPDLARSGGSLPRTR